MYLKGENRHMIILPRPFSSVVNISLQSYVYVIKKTVLFNKVKVFLWRK